MNTQNDSPTSRRQFIKTSTAVAVTGALAPYLSFPDQAFAANSDTLKIGLVGCGGRGSGAAGQALKADKNVILTAVADVFESQCQGALNGLRNDAAIKDRVQVDPDHTFVGLDAYQKLIASGLDVVLLATPPGFRPQHFQAAVEAGKQVFVEKPMATDVPGVRSIMASVEVAKQKKLAVVAGFCWRYDYGRREFYQRVRDGALGDIRAVYATYLTSPVKPMEPANKRPPGMSDIEWQLRNWYNFVWICGDGLVEQACHSIDKIAWAMKDVPPLKATATGGRQFPNHEGNIFDHIDVCYEYADGARAFMAQRQTTNCYNDNSDYVMGAHGTGTNGWGAAILKAKETWRYDGPKNDMYQTEHDEFFTSIRKGEPINNGDWMAKSTLMAIMGRTAAYTGQQITWEQALNLQEKLVPDNLEWNMKLPIVPLAMPGKTKLA